MELDFARHHIFDTTFVSPTGTGTPKPVYRVSTSRLWGVFPHKTKIESIGATPNDHRTIAQIIWSGPTANTNYVVFGPHGHLYSLSEFLGFGEGEGYFNTDSFITLGNETYTWRSYRFEPQLYDSRGKQVAWYKADPYNLFGPRALGHLRIDESLTSDRDVIFTSFIIFMRTRNVYWKKKPEPEVVDVPETKITTLVANNENENKEAEMTVQAVVPECRADDGQGDKAESPRNA